MTSGCHLSQELPFKKKDSISWLTLACPTISLLKAVIILSQVTSLFSLIQHCNTLDNRTILSTCSCCRPLSSALGTPSSNPISYHRCLIPANSSRSLCTSGVESSTQPIYGQ